MTDSSNIFLISLVFLGLSMLVSAVFKNKFKKYSRMRLYANMSGKEVADKMLMDSGIYDVKVVSASGFMSDHYNPADKTINLSPDVYSGTSVAAAAVAAHECGHAVQHATAYQWLTLRSKLVPMVQFSSSIIHWVLLAGIVTVNAFPQLLLGGIVLFALTTVFSLVTLPVEFDASSRALVWLRQSNITTLAEQPQAKDALKWAAMTYVVAALSSVAMLIQYVLIYLNGSRRS